MEEFQSLFIDYSYIGAFCVPKMEAGNYENPLFVECSNFAPPLTGEEMCRALGPVANHVLAVLPKGRDTWEVHVNEEGIREYLEVEGLTIRGRHLEVSRRFPGGTWVRIRGIALNVPNEKINIMMRKYGDVVGEATHCTWRNTHIKTGDRTIKIKLATDIPGRVRHDSYGWVTFRYRNQPEVCFSCGKAGHQQWECEGPEEETSRKSYAGAAAAPPEAPPTPSSESELAIDTSTGEDREDDTVKEKKKKDKKDRKKEKKERKREHVTPEDTPEKEARHVGLPILAPTSKLRKT